LRALTPQVQIRFNLYMRVVAMLGFAFDPIFSPG